MEADGIERVVALPPRPGIRAVRLDSENVRLTYRFGQLERDCRPAFLQVILDENDTPAAGDRTVARVHASEGTLTISVPEDLREADVVRAIARTKKGLPSDAAAALIR